MKPRLERLLFLDADLSGADLDEAILSGAYLEFANPDLMRHDDIFFRHQSIRCFRL